MQELESPVVVLPQAQESVARLDVILAAYHEKSLYKIIANLNPQQMKDDTACLEMHQIPFETCLYSVLIIVYIYHDQSRHHISADELKEIETKGIESYLADYYKENLDCLDKLKVYIDDFNRILKQQKEKYIALSRESILKNLQEIVRLYNACTPYDAISCAYSNSSRYQFIRCAVAMVSLLSQWPSERNWPLENNSGAIQLDYTALRRAVERLRNDVVPKEQTYLDVLACNIDICYSCDEIDRIIAQTGNSADRQELETQLQRLFKDMTDSLIEKSSNNDRFEKNDAHYFRRMILINIWKYTSHQYRADTTGIIDCLYKSLEDLFHTFFKFSKIRLSNYREYLILAEECNGRKVFFNCKYALESCLIAYLNAWLAFIKTRYDKNKKGKDLVAIRTLQTVSPDELTSHLSVILEFRNALNRLSHNQTKNVDMAVIEKFILYPHFDRLMQIITVDLSNRDVFLKLIKYLFKIKHPNALTALKYYYRSYTEHLISHSSVYAMSVDAEGRVIIPNSASMRNWVNLLAHVDKHWRDGQKSYAVVETEDYFPEPAQQGFDFKSCYLEVIYCYFTHTHITDRNVELALEWASELKRLNSSETEKILSYIYTDFIAFVNYHLEKLDFPILQKMLYHLALENDYLKQEKQSLFCSYLKVLLFEVIFPEMDKEPKSNGLYSFADSHVYSRDIIPLTHRAGNSLKDWLDIYNRIIRCNKKLFGSDPQYVVNLRDIVSLLAPHISAEISPPPLAKKVVEESEPVKPAKKVVEDPVSPKTPYVINLNPSDHVDESATSVTLSAQPADPRKQIEELERQPTIQNINAITTVADNMAAAVSLARDTQDHNTAAQPSDVIDEHHDVAARSSSVNSVMTGFLWRKPEASSYFNPAALKPAAQQFMQQSSDAGQKKSQEKIEASSATVSMPARKPALQQSEQQSTRAEGNSIQNKPLPPSRHGVYEANLEKTINTELSLLRAELNKSIDTKLSAELEKAIDTAVSLKVDAWYAKKIAELDNAVDKRIAAELALQSIMKKAPAVPVHNPGESDDTAQVETSKDDSEKNNQRVAQPF